jgi:Ca2+-binding EF-hand superfamily protein
MFYKFTDEDWESTQQHLHAQEVPLDVLAVMLKRLLKLPSNVVNSACETMDDLDGCGDGFINLGVLETFMRRTRVAMKSSRDMKLRRIALREEYRDAIYKREQLNLGGGMLPNQQTHQVCDELADQLVEDLNHSQLHSQLQGALDNRVGKTKPKRPSSAGSARTSDLHQARRPQSAGPTRARFQRRGVAQRDQQSAAQLAVGCADDVQQQYDYPESDLDTADGIGDDEGGGFGDGGGRGVGVGGDTDRHLHGAVESDEGLPDELEYTRLQVSQKLHQKYSHLTQAFISIDSDRDGVIGMEELGGMCQAFNLRIAENEMMRLVMCVNGGDDTLLSRDQFNVLFAPEDMVDDVNAFVGADEKRLQREQAEKRRRTLAERQRQRQLQESEARTKKQQQQQRKPEQQLQDLHQSITKHILAHHKGYGGDEHVDDDGIPAEYLVDFLEHMPDRQNAFSGIIAELQANAGSRDEDHVYHVGIQLASHLLVAYENLRNSFKLADTDHHGFVDHSELVRGMANYHLPTKRVLRLLASMRQGGDGDNSTLRFSQLLKTFGQEYYVAVGPEAIKLVQEQIFPGVKEPVRRKRAQAPSRPSRSMAALSASLDQNIHAKFAAPAAMECAKNLKLLRRLLNQGKVQSGMINGQTFAKVLRNVLGMQVTDEEVAMLQEEFSADRVLVSVQALLRRVRAVLGAETKLVRTPKRMV